MLRRDLAWAGEASVAGALALLTVSSGCGSRGSADRPEAGGGSESVSPAAIGGVERLRMLPAVRERLDRGLPLVATECGFRTPTKEVSPIGHWRPAGGRPDVTLPRTAAAPTRLAFAGDPDLWLEVASAGDRDVPAELVHGTLVHRGTSDDVDVFRVLQTSGAEEFRWLGSSKAASRIEYRVTHGPGVERLRVTAGAVEAVDRSGTVRFKMERPWSIDAQGTRRGAEVTLTGARDTWRVGVAIDRASAFPVALDPSWAVVSSMASARAQHTATLLADGSVMVFGGNTSIEGPIAERYDPVSDRWTTLGSPSGFVGPGSTADFAAVALSGDEVLVLGGSAHAAVFDPTSNAWKSTNYYALSSSGHPPTAALLTSGKVLAAANDVSSDAELYDPATNGWTSAGTLSSRASSSSYLFANLLDGRVLAAGLEKSGTLLLGNVYDPETNAWTVTGAMPTGASSQGDFVSLLGTGKVLYLDIGARGSVYDPATNIWAKTGALAAEGGTAFSLSDGRVLVPFDFYATSGIYNPLTNLWAQVGGLSSAANSRGGVVLTNGRVLVVGGWINTTVADGGVTTLPISSSDVFDPITSSWTFGGSLSDARGDHTTTLLKSGKVLVAGGYGSLASLSSAEIFTPLALSLGASCTAPGECVSTFCVDGVCCDSACTGTCASCAAATKVSGADGTCGLANAGADPHATCKDDGSPRCANDGLCDGAGACRKYPVSTNCTPTPCTKGADCSSGFCADGVCCDTKCDGTCQACSKALKGSGLDGVCGPAAAGTDPHDQCPTDAGFPANCHADGLCDGAGACRVFAPAATICGTPSCAAGVQKTPTCDGAGVCNLGSASCSPFACSADGTVCAKTCAVDADCGMGAYCDTGTCKPKKSNGEVASATSQCQSGIVADGVCCNDACTGLCEACDAGTTTKGTCTAVVGTAKHGTCPPATGGDPCSGGVCDGSTRTSCAGLPGPSIICQPGSCGDGLEVPQGLCDGSGTCQAPKARKCDPYVCGAKACLSTCTTAADCVAGSRCDASSGKCVASGSCSTDLTSATSATGESTKCYPVLCVPSTGQCGQVCQSAADCASSLVCNAQGQCVDAPSLTSGSGGCASSGRGERSGALAGGIVAAAVLLRRRRRLRGTSTASRELRA